MQTNFYFLFHACQTLEKTLSKAVLAEAFTQNKNELLLIFTLADHSDFNIRIRVDPEFPGLSFPENIQRARKNSVDIFTELINKQVTGVKLSHLDRSFHIAFETEFSLFVKFYGNRSNVALFQEGKVVGLFKQKLSNDKHLELPVAYQNGTSGISQEVWRQAPSQVNKFWPVAGKEIRTYLQEQEYEGLRPAQQLNLLTALEEQLFQATKFYIENWNDKPTITLFRSNYELIKSSSNVFEAANSFYRLVTTEYYLGNRKQALLKEIQKRIKSTEGYIDKTSQSLKQLANTGNLRQVADVIMANLHQIPNQATEVKLLNFYTNQDQYIKLKKELNPQQNAERYYQKAKSQHKQVAFLEKNLEQKEERLLQLLTWKEQIEQAESFDAIKLLEKEIQPQFKHESTRLPYWETDFQGWKIFVGRGAKDNDEMLRYFSHKDDWWLHAKEAAGSHVLVKFQSGKKTPLEVLEKAASLAAWHSKRKNDSLCPVICTPRKWIRKRKGGAPGMVAVDREEKVLLVKPEAD